MSSPSIAATGNAKQRTAQACGQVRTSVRFTESVMRIAQSIFHSKIPVKLAARAKCGIRTAEYWKSGKRDMGIDDFVALLQGEEGIAFMQAWWAVVPETTREHWFRNEVDRRRLEAAEQKMAKAAREVVQMRMEFKKQ